MNITVHDCFTPGDTVRLVHEDGRTLVTDYFIEVAEPAVSVTFASVTPRNDVVLIIDRTRVGDAAG